MIVKTVSSVDASKKIPAGVCGILLGSFGIHKYILGYYEEGTIMLVGTIIIAVTIEFPIFGIIGLIEGISYLTKSDEDFINTYITNKKGWF